MGIESVEIKIMPPSGIKPEGVTACRLKMTYGRMEPE